MPIKPPDFNMNIKPKVPAKLKPKVDKLEPHRWQVKGYAPLEDGDLLFRYFHSKDPDRESFLIPLPWGYGIGPKLYTEIRTVQKDQHAWNGLYGNRADACIFHVGIYVEDNVIEIGGDGVQKNPVMGRDHYDIVVRFPGMGDKIATVAKEVDSLKWQGNQGIGWYPVLREKLVNLPAPLYNVLYHKIPQAVTDLAFVLKPNREISSYDKGESLRDRRLAEHWGKGLEREKGKEVTKEVPRTEQWLLTGGLIPARERMWLMLKDKETKPKQFALSQKVVCSHLVSAILYAVQNPGGTVRTATDPEFDYIFKMTPSHLLHEAYLHRNLCNGAMAVGMQHTGTMVSEHDLGEMIHNGDKYCEQLGFKLPLKMVA